MTYACRHSVVRAIPLAKRRHHAAPRRPPNSFPSIGMRNFGCRVWKSSNRNPGWILKECLQLPNDTFHTITLFKLCRSWYTFYTMKGRSNLGSRNNFLQFCLFRREKGILILDSDFSLRNYPYGGEKKKYITANRSMCSRRCHKLITKKDSAIQARKLAKRLQNKHDEICVSIQVAVMREGRGYEDCSGEIWGRTKWKIVSCQDSVERRGRIWMPRRLQRLKVCRSN